MNEWKETRFELPPENILVKTKIDDCNGCRNEQSLIRRRNLWFVYDESMYVYYHPTHWKAYEPCELEQINQAKAELAADSRQLETKRDYLRSLL